MRILLQIFAVARFMEYFNVQYNRATFDQSRFLQLHRFRFAYLDAALTSREVRFLYTTLQPSNKDLPKRFVSPVILSAVAHNSTSQKAIFMEQL